MHNRIFFTLLKKMDFSKFWKKLVFYLMIFHISCIHFKTGKLLAMQHAAKFPQWICRSNSMRHTASDFPCFKMNGRYVREKILLCILNAKFLQDSSNYTWNCLFIPKLCDFAIFAMFPHVGPLCNSSYDWVESFSWEDKQTL